MILIMIGLYAPASLASVLAAVGIGLLIASSGLVKIFRPGQFVAALRDYRLVPSRIFPFVAIALPVLEFSAGLAILVDRESPVAAGTGAILLLAFAGAMAINLMRGRRPSCGCEIRKHPVSWLLVLRNVVFAGLAFGGTADGLRIASIMMLIGLVGFIGIAILEWLTPRQSASRAA
ncbi:MAG TPA: MauE/DoxX family redox-associated membrane protein [Candidatus Acidoferrales bacterium]|nr:MauE/DoxX family redox-associated membrane protein [Candidatus Acidoferrales bacterium]